MFLTKIVNIFKENTINLLYNEFVKLKKRGIHNEIRKR